MIYKLNRFNYGTMYGEAKVLDGENFGQKVEMLCKCGMRYKAWKQSLLRGYALTCKLCKKDKMKTQEYSITEEEKDDRFEDVQRITLNIPVAVLKTVIDEMNRGESKFGKFKSDHELYAVLKEEMEEFWDEIKADGTNYRRVQELTQVCAVALRGLVELSERAPV